MAAFNLQPEEPLEPDDYERALRLEKLRLKRHIIQEHRAKANIARLVAKKEDVKADRLAKSIGESTTLIVHDDSPAIFRLDSTQSDGTKNDERLVVVKRKPSTYRPVRKSTPTRAKSVVRTTSAEKHAASAARPAAPTQPPPNESNRRRISRPWMLSVLLHVAFVLPLMLLTFSTVEESQVSLSSSMSEIDESAIPELAELELNPVEIDETDLEDLPEEIGEAENDELFAEDFISPLMSDDDSLLDTPATVDLIAGNIGDLMAGVPSEGEGGGQSAGGKRGAGGTEASFFGTKSRGSRFVFLVDNSGSMVDGRMETTLLELQRSIEALKEDQFFSIVFYSDQVYPLFYPNSEAELLPATRENKLKVAEWLPTVEMCLGGRLREAMDLVRELDPEVVYLLSDGDIRSDPLIRHLTEPNDWKFTIHTFGMTVRNPDHLGKLRAISTAHGGQFVPVSIHPAAAQMAKQRPIKYHREPGPVWGTKVRPWN